MIYQIKPDYALRISYQIKPEKKLSISINIISTPSESLIPTLEPFSLSRVGRTG
jgi:hypothetical protein